MNLNKICWEEDVNWINVVHNGNVAVRCELEKYFCVTQHV
jgi:hypothetical protein